MFTKAQMNAGPAFVDVGVQGDSRIYAGIRSESELTDDDCARVFAEQ